MARRKIHSGNGGRKTMVRSSFLAVHGWHPSLYAIDRNETLKAENRALDAEYIREWVKAYAETKPEGLLPNPYKHGVANTVWPDWTGLNDFWGFTAEGYGSIRRRQRKNRSRSSERPTSSSRILCVNSSPTLYRVFGFFRTCLDSLIRLSEQLKKP